MAYSDQWEPLFESVKRLRAGWPSRGWTWDSRLICATSSFSAQFEAKARIAAAHLLPNETTTATLAKASSRLRDVADRSGGLRAGQLLLSGGPFGVLVPFGLWWPWGDGETISLRVGLCDLDSMRDPYPKFREILGAAV